MFLYLAMIDSDADKSKFEILYSEYKNLMYYTANRILRNSSDAEDVVHQAFLKVIEILDTISSPRCHKTRALLVTITEHKAIDLYREKQRRNVLPLAEEYIGAAPAAEIERLAERDSLAAAIASLPPRYRSVLLLRYDCGYSNAEIVTSGPKASMTLAQTKSFQPLIKAKMTVATSAGSTSGKPIRQYIPKRVQPSIRALSSSSIGSACVK